MTIPMLSVTLPWDRQDVLSVRRIGGQSLSQNRDVLGEIAILHIRTRPHCLLDTGFRDHDVARLQIPMGDAARVSRSQGLGYLRTVPQHQLDGERALAQAHTKRFPFDQFHHQVIWADVVKGANVRMVEGGDCASLALEACDKLCVSDLNGHGTTEPGVGGAVHLAHTSGPEWQKTAACGLWLRVQCFYFFSAPGIDSVLLPSAGSQCSAYPILFPAYRAHRRGPGFSLGHSR